jgi:hypothetical protein
MNMAVFCVVTLMMQAASTSATSVNLYQNTRRNNPEDSHIFLLFFRTCSPYRKQARGA